VTIDSDKSSFGLVYGHCRWSYGIRDIEAKGNTSLNLISLSFWVIGHMKMV
jgi:hypothetical protein